MVQKINLKEKADSIESLFTYLRVGKLNDHMLNIVNVENRTLDFHVHENSDEMFYCIEGEFDIEFEDGLTHLREGDIIIIPKGMRHRPVCKSLVKCLLVEVEGTLDKSNTGGTYDE
ncbi:MAG TPA: cupin domain-containing protein [Clostridiales bacterium]|jgi:mannose-6-phosphate isomerase-like protein (cupin superfamily)|nr:cupin domain-containing protein [Clostridiales bacterium]